MTLLTPTAWPKAPLLPLRGEGLGGLVLAFALLTSPATAQILASGTPAADIVLARAIADWRVFVTCSVLDQPTHADVLDALAEDTNAATTILTAQKIPPEAITAFKTAIRPDALTPAPDTAFAKVAELCRTLPDWKDRWRDQQFTVLERDLGKAFP